MYNLYSLKIKELLFGPIRSTLVHFGLLQSTLVPFSPIWSAGEFFFPQVLCLGRKPTKTEHLGKKNFPVGTRDNFFSQMLCLGREPTKTEHLGKKFPQWTKLD